MPMQSMTAYYADESVTLHHGDALAVLARLEPGSVDCIVTSPPYYGLRDYGTPGQYGHEPSPGEYVETMRSVFAEARRVLADDGTLWLNIGDGYANASPGGTQGKTGQRATRTFTATGSGGCTALPAKNLMGMPWRVAFALQNDGWTLRNDVIWHKAGALPTSATDRLANKHEHLFLFAKSRRYFFDLDAIRQPAISERPAGNRPETSSAYGRSAGGRSDGRHYGGNPSSTLADAHDLVNPGDVWRINAQPFIEAHFACMPTALAERCILTSKPGCVVLDPFSGSGTTGLAATRLGRRYVGIDINREYLDLSLRTRLAQGALIDGEAS